MSSALYGVSKAENPVARGVDAISGRDDDRRRAVGSLRLTCEAVTRLFGESGSRGCLCGGSRALRHTNDREQQQQDERVAPDARCRADELLHEPRRVAAGVDARGDCEEAGARQDGRRDEHDDRTDARPDRVRWADRKQDDPAFGSLRERPGVARLIAQPRECVVANKCVHRRGVRPDERGEGCAEVGQRLADTRVLLGLDRAGREVRFGIWTRIEVVGVDRLVRGIVATAVVVTLVGHQ